MPLRPIQHQIEDASRRALQTALPMHWVFRNKSADYGIDGEIEIFSETGESTGLLCFVQIKGTTEKNARTARTISIHTNKLKYLVKLPAPTLLVRYTHRDGRLYGRWAHDPSLDRTDKDYVRVRFNSSNELNASSTPKIPRELRIVSAIRNSRRLEPISIYLDWKRTHNRPLKSTILARLQSHIDRIPGLLALVNDEDAALCRLTVEDNRLQSTIGHLCTYYVDGIDRYPSTHFQQIVCDDAVMSVGANLAQIKRYELAAAIFAEFARESLAAHSGEMALIIARSFAAAHRYDAAICVYEALLKAAPGSASVAALELAILENTDRLSDASSRQLTMLLQERLSALETQNDPIATALAHYNLGATLRRDPRSSSIALQHYRKACRHFPKFGQSAPLWSETGEVLLARGRYRSAAAAFERAVAVGSQPRDIAYLADAQFFSGKYNDARFTLKRYLVEAPIAEAEYCLKYIAWRTFIQHTGVRTQVRHPQEATKILVSSDVPNTREQLERICDKVFDEDACMPGLWEALAFAAIEEKEYEDVHLYFLISALMSRHDVSAWVNAISTATCDPSAVRAVPLLIEAAYMLNGSHFSSAMASALPKAPKEIRPALLYFLETIVPQLTRKKQRPGIHKVIRGRRAALIPADGAAGAFRHI